MELFALQAAAKLSIGNRVQPLKFKEVLANGALEKDLEDLIVAQPSLLNWSDPGAAEYAELLIISRQPRTLTRKRADLFAISDAGELVVIEIKRDADDEKGRREGMEFQAIRYAAASRKMTASAIIDMFADHLKSLDVHAGKTAERDIVYREHAISNLCEHLADEDQDLTESDLQELLDPKAKQKIYLVAAGYEADVLSACAWLRQHDIEIACFQLRPYRVGDQLLLERDRLIPPPQLDDFLVEMRPSSDGATIGGGASVERRKADKASAIKWDDEPDNQQVVSSWKEVLLEATTKALRLGLAVERLPMPHAGNGTKLRSPAEIQPGLCIECHASAELIRDWISKMFQRLGKNKAYLRVETRSGSVFELPEVSGTTVDA
ncbi:MAG TPA: hypothetical protein PKD86_10735 [Gemmatales bacterium]|nr:hypothetical protein [Gemmatales bacterium]HMP59820.1 hypothetical protein [Gemmatales bacterium]